MSVTVPASLLVEGSHTIKVGNANGISTTILPFSVTSHPSVTSITPSSGPLGTQVTVTGNGFSLNDVNVFFYATPTSGVNIPARSTDGHTITFTIPSQYTVAPGPKNITIETDTDDVTTTFTVTSDLGASAGNSSPGFWGNVWKWLGF